MRQVCHHPPVSALHAESVHGWHYNHEYLCETKFSIRGTLKVGFINIARAQ